MRGNNASPTDIDIGSQLTVIVPTKNEEEAIGKVLDELLKVGIPAKNIIVVDGHSTDRTREIASSYNVKVVLQRGRGKADAVKQGIELSATPFVAIIDGDYTYPAKHIPEMLEKIAGNNDCGEIIGARLRGRENIPAVNRLGNWVLTRFFNLLFGSRLKDVLSGLYIVRRSLLDHILFETKGFSIEVEIAAHVIGSGYQVCEHPIEYRKRLGEKKLSIRHGFEIFRDIIRLSWSYNPVFLIAGASAALLIPGLALAGWVAYHYYTQGVKHHVRGLISLSFTLVGLQSLLIAVLAIYLKRFELRLLRLLRRRNQPG